MPDEVRTTARRQLARMSHMTSSSPEYNVARTYLETLLDLPWGINTEDTLDVAAARAILDADHAGLEKVKKRILEFVAVRKLAPDKHGPILCLVGPPGVGKTSLGRSIATALNRRYVRTALGGLRDEAEIRGHRRTYIGALPGRIANALKKAGSMNPVMVLDELDKLGSDHRGDPSSALLEVLDPEQNKAFSDHDRSGRLLLLRPPGGVHRSNADRAFYGRYIRPQSSPCYLPPHTGHLFRRGNRL